MQNIVLLVLFVLGIVFIQFGEGLSVDGIIDKYIDARGGNEKLNSIKSIYMEGFREILGNEIPVTVTIVNEKLFRNDFVFEGIAGYLIVTPTKGWSFVPMHSQNINLIAADDLTMMQFQLDIAGPIVDYAAKGNRAELKGRETVAGNETYKIILTSAGKKETTYYIDTKTKYLIQTKHFRSGADGKKAEIITNFSDYVSVDGIMFPHTITNPENGMSGGTTTFNTIILNKMINEDQYKPAE